MLRFGPGFDAINGIISIYFVCPIQDFTSGSSEQKGVHLFGLRNHHSSKFCLMRLQGFAGVYASGCARSCEHIKSISSLPAEGAWGSAGFSAESGG